MWDIKPVQAHLALSDQHQIVWNGYVHLIRQICRMRRVAGHLATARLSQWLFGESAGLLSHFHTRNTQWYIKLQSRNPKNWISRMMRWRKITPNPKRRNCGNSPQILERLAWFWSTFLFRRGPRRNVPSFKTHVLNYLSFPFDRLFFHVLIARPWFR